MAVFKGTLDLREYAASDVPLYKSFDSMLRANRVKVPRRNRVL